MFGRGDEPAAQLSAPRPAHKRIGGFWRSSQQDLMREGDFLAGASVTVRGDVRWRSLVRAGTPTRQERCASLRDQPAAGS